jgi:Putative MetA-pathway of phenol degradation
MDLVRRALTALALCGLGFSARTAHAQLCHDLPDLEAHHHAGKARAAGEPGVDGSPSSAGEHATHGADGDGHGDHGDHGLGVALGLRLEAATAAIERRPIDYQGTTLRVDLHLRRFHLRAQGSWYRLRNSIEHTTGPGDLMLAAMWTAYQGERLHAGLALPVGLPTGDDEERLGMGHVMIMPGVFVALKATPAITISAGLAYNRALESGEGHNHGIGPYVNPMTKEELGGAARISVRTAPRLQLVGETAIAAPLDGKTRMIVGGGFALQHERMALSVLAQAGALYEPFTARGVADLAYAF